MTKPALRLHGAARMNLFPPVNHSEEVAAPGRDLVIRISFSARAREAYLIQRSRDQQQWVNVVPVPAGSARIIEIAAPRNGVHRFYRVVPAAQPAPEFS